MRRESGHSKIQNSRAEILNFFLTSENLEFVIKGTRGGGGNVYFVKFDALCQTKSHKTARPALFLCRSCKLYRCVALPSLITQTFHRLIKQHQLLPPTLAHTARSVQQTASQQPWRPRPSRATVPALKSSPEETLSAGRSQSSCWRSSVLLDSLSCGGRAPRANVVNSILIINIYAG